ncbi:hypothetical protein FRC01_005566 [Tulasnella sp. 417]|nr:hypothetical protein FRC01_005566 [Tulasnella sp. 417]
MDSRFAEDFGDINADDNPPFSPNQLWPRCISATPPLITKVSRCQKLRRHSSEKSADTMSEGWVPSSPSTSSLWTRSELEAYLETRAAIKKARSDATSPGAIDWSSSCNSISLSSEDPDLPEVAVESAVLEPKPNQATSRHVLSLMRVAAVKWQARKQFFELTSDPRCDSRLSTTHASCRLRTAADRLLSASSKGEQWASIVARRFTKTTARQIAGLRAVLRLRVEEERHLASSYPGTILRPDCPSRSYMLLKLIFTRMEPQSLFQDVVPAVLQEWPADKPRAVVWLARVVWAFMSHVDEDVMSKYGTQVIQNAEPWTNEWLNGVWLLTALFLGHVAWTTKPASILSVAKFILHVGMESLGKEPFAGSETPHIPNEGARLKVLFSVVIVCLNCEEHILNSVVPSIITLGPFVEACVDMLLANGPMMFSALKALALLRDIPAVMENLPPSRMAALVDCCMDAVLGRAQWNNPLTRENVNIGPFAVVPEEDAFDILCRLPPPTFPGAIAKALADCPITLNSSSPDQFQVFNMLEPLLWLSNIPDSIPEAHQALVNGAAFEFLEKIILDSPQKSWSWHDRALWRAKGEAITCLGNIIEKMGEAELRSHLSEDVLMAMVEIKDNAETPLAQRYQVTLTLQRYEAVLCGGV